MKNHENPESAPAFRPGAEPSTSRIQVRIMEFGHDDLEVRDSDTRSLWRILGAKIFRPFLSGLTSPYPQNARSS
jgi:hypothetical protein